MTEIANQNMVHTGLQQQPNPYLPVKTYVEGRLPSINGLFRNQAHRNELMAGFYACIKKNPKLLDCDKDSLFMSVVFAAQTGLQLGVPRGGVSLVPFGKKVTPIIDYRGLIAIAKRQGEISSIKAEGVFTGEKFEWEEGTGKFIKHSPLLERDRLDYAAMTAVYAVAYFKDGSKPEQMVLGKKEVEFYRSKSAGAQRSDSPWKVFPVAMAKKTAILRLCNILPGESRELDLAVEHEMRTEVGLPTEDLFEDVIEHQDDPPAPQPEPSGSKNKGGRGKKTEQEPEVLESNQAYLEDCKDALEQAKADGTLESAYNEMTFTTEWEALSQEQRDELTGIYDRMARG